MMLFIHSTGSGPLLWSTVPDDLGPSPKLRPPNLGYSPNPRIERGVKLDASREDARSLVERLPSFDGVHIVGHSYGCLVALHVVEAMLARGGSVASLFFYEPVLFGQVRDEVFADPAARQEIDGFLQHPWFLTDESRAGGEAWVELFIDYWNRPGSWAKMPPALREATLAVGWKMFQEVRSCFFDETPFDMTRWTMPATIVRGDRSPATSRAMAAAFAKKLPNAKLVDVERTGHMAPITHPGIVHAALRQHLA